MSEGKDLVATGSFYLTLDSVANAGLGGIFWIILLKIAAPDVVGRGIVVVGLVSILVVFSGLGFQIGASKFIAEYNSKGQGSLSRFVFSKTVQVTLGSSVVIAIGLAFASPLVSAVLKDPQYELLILVGALALPFQSFVRSLNGVYQGCHRMAYCFVGDVTFLVLRLVVAIALVLAGFGSLGIVTGYAVGFVASTILGLVVLAPSALPKALPISSPPFFGKVFRFAFPNYLSTIADTGANYVSVILLGVYSGADAVAFYNPAFLSKLVLVALATSVGLALLPTVSSVVSGGSRQTTAGLYNISVRTAILLSSVPALVFFLLPERVLGLISPAYSSASLALQILVVSAFGSVIFQVSISALNGLNRPLSALWATGLGAILGIGASLVLIPRWGVPGAAAGNLVDGLASGAIAVAVLSARGSVIIARFAHLLQNRSLQKSGWRLRFSALVEHLSALPSVRIHTGSLVRPILCVVFAVLVGELCKLAGIRYFILVPASLATLLGTALILEALTMTELRNVIRLTVTELRNVIQTYT